MRESAVIVILAAAAMTATVSCGEERHSYVPNVSDGEKTPTMTTRDVETFISDSGYTRYHISTPQWDMYEEAAEPHWKFPEGLELEQYDLSMRSTGNIRSIEAIYFSRKRLWQLDGDVVMVNTMRDSFLTEQLFWDQTSRKVYSDSFVHIVRSDRIIEGYGFESNENMTEYVVNNPTAIIPVDRTKAGGNKEVAVPADSTDSMPTMSASGRRGAPVRASERRPEPAVNNDSAPGGLRAIRQKQHAPGVQEKERVKRTNPSIK